MRIRALRSPVRSALVAASAAFASFVIFAGATAPARAADEPPEPLALGARAPDFSLPGVDGKTWTLADFARAKALVIVFTCNHCPTAQLYEDRIRELAADYEDKGVALVAISPNDPEAVRLDELGWSDLGDSFEEMKIRAAALELDFPYLYDGETQAASRAYGPQTTPHVFIFDSERLLRYRGRIDDSESGKKITRRDARDALDAVLEGRAVAEATTRVFGCSVKWSDKRDSNRKFLEKLAAEDVSLSTLSVAGARALRENPGKKLLVLNVWATTCAPCIAEMPELVETHRMYRHRELDFVTVSIDPLERTGEALKILKKSQASNRNCIVDSDDRDAFADALDKEWSGALPFTLLLAPGGRVLLRRQGAVDVLELRRAIVANLAPWKDE